MILWLWRLIWGESECRHCWVTIEEIDLYSCTLVDTAESVLPDGRKSIMQCSLCGDRKSVIL